MRSSRGLNKTRFVIFKVSDAQRSVVVDETSTESDYEVFRRKLSGADGQAGDAMLLPRFAVYDVEFDLGQDGKRTKTVFISWAPQGTPLEVCYCENRGGHF
jgi:cofilin